MNDHSGPAPAPNKRVLRTMHRLSLFCALAGLALMIGGLLVRSASVFDAMSASANLVVVGESAVMSDGEFVRSLLPAACAAGIVHLVGVVAGLVGRTRAEGRGELARCALGAGANASFLACACIIPVVGMVRDPRALVPLLVVCGAAALAACVALFRRVFASPGAISVGAGVTGMLAMAGALLVGLFAMLHELATTPGRPFLPALIVVAAASVAAVAVQLTLAVCVHKQGVGLGVGALAAFLCSGLPPYHLAPLGWLIPWGVAGAASPIDYAPTLRAGTVLLVSRPWLNSALAVIVAIVWVVLANLVIVYKESHR